MHILLPSVQPERIFLQESLLKALWGGHTAALQFSICISAQGCRFGKEACNSKWATAGGRYHHDMFKTYPANVDSSTYLCDVTSNDRERFFRK